jgi:CelD/BcsL family acetyltransferase involved in cellulose biosynthesis
MMVTHIAGLRVLRWLSDPWAQYGDVLAAQGHDASDLMARALEMIGHNKVADAIWLRHVREDATAHPFLRTSFEHTGHSNGAPFMDLTKFPTESEYLARYSKQQRKRRRQIQRTLENIGNLRFESHEQGSALAKGIAEAIRQKRIWLSDRGLISKPIFSNWLESFLLGLSTDTAGRLNVVCSILKAGDRPVSYEIGLRYRERHCCFITAHDNALTDDSPSRLHMDHAQRSALKEGYKAFDLMVPLSRHKQSWSSGHVPVSDYWLPLSARGRIAGSIILKALRPLARAAYNRTPPILRRAACALIG